MLLNGLDSSSDRSADRTRMNVNRNDHATQEDFCAIFRAHQGLSTSVPQGRKPKRCDLHELPRNKIGFNSVMFVN
jgi:hypothetical protein